MGKITFLGIFTAIFLLLFVALQIPYLLKATFAINFVLLWIITYYNIYIERKFSPFLGVFIVFNLLFFIVAPLLQIDDIISKGYNEGGKYIQNFPFKEGFAIRANLYILFFNLIFFSAYLYFKSRTIKINSNFEISYFKI